MRYAGNLRRCVRNIAQAQNAWQNRKLVGRNLLSRPTATGPSGNAGWSHFGLHFLSCSGVGTQFRNCMVRQEPGGAQQPPKRREGASQQLSKRKCQRLAIAGSLFSHVALASRGCPGAPASRRKWTTPRQTAVSQGCEGGVFERLAERAQKLLQFVVTSATSPPGT